MKASSLYHVGDSVIVKPDVHDPDLDLVIGGWQGTISDTNDEYNTVCVDWDSHTFLRPASDRPAITKLCSGSGLCRLVRESISWRARYIRAFSRG